MKKRITVSIFCMFLYCILLVGCGSVGEHSLKESEVLQSEEVSSQSSAVPSQSQIYTEGWQPTPVPDLSAVDDKLEELKATKEAIITVGVTSTGEDNVYQAINSFNSSQDKYWAVVKVYDELSQLLLELTSNKGPDIYYVSGMNYTALAQNGMFEELTPYLESSEMISKEDIISSAWRAGSVEGKLYFILPRFYPRVMLVEKGYTKNGAWTMEEYFALAEKYPEGKLSENITDLEMLIINDLSLSLDSYVNWEEYTCSFDSVEFVNLLKRLKIYQEKQYESFADYNLAQQLQQKMLLTERTNILWKDFMVGYKNLRDTLLEFCEIAGMPNEAGELKYLMKYEEFYGMSVVSKNKEAAWSFLEYTLSEEYLTLQHDDGGPRLGMYPANRKVLESFLDAEIGNVPDYVYRYKNEYINAKVDEVTEFTEEDKQVLLNILENCYAGRWIETKETFKILTEELDYFFQGGKSAEEVAKIIQSRMSLYLMECQ